MLSAAYGLDLNHQGVAVVRMVWSNGWQRSVAEIVQATSVSELQQQASVSVDTSGQVIGAVDAALRDIAPEVQITWAERPGGYSTFGGWDMPGTWGLVYVIVLGLFLVVLTNGPDPRWATRWAWFWLLLTPLVFFVVPAYLILGARPHVRGRRRRLTGGWAFLIAFLVLGPLGGR